MSCNSKIEETKILVNEKVKNKKKVKKSKKDLKQRMEMNKAYSKEKNLEYNERIVKSFIVLKTDMNDEKRVPFMWKIVGYNSLEKLFSRKNGKSLYKQRKQYGIYNSNKQNLLYYRAPISFVKNTSKELIIDFHK